MKKNYITVSISILLFAGVGPGMLSCHKAMNRSTYTNTLLQQIAGDSDLVILNAAIKRTRLDTVFQSGGPFTFFAPVDSAFIHAGLTVDKINAFDADSLRSILTYHIVVGNISSQNILGFLRRNFVSVNPHFEPFVAKNYQGIFIDGIHVDQGNIICGDGVLQKIGRVCTVPVGNMLQTVVQQPNLTYLATILRANLSYTLVYYPFTTISFNSLFTAAADSFYTAANLEDQGQSNQPKPLYSNFTFFLPSDAAFRAAGWTIDSINAAIGNDPNNLLNLVANGMVCNEYFTADFLQGFFINKYGGTDVHPDAFTYFNINPMIGIQDGGRSMVAAGSAPASTFPQYNTQPVFVARIVQPDIVATDGSIQVIDSVLNFQ